ncbi:hypothetical protein [Symbiopectobacterium purcellii]|uniref:Uncharacterized protein n=1 Tax=Symbiopectobacterium purcellii TaxID=2871826 RepID=A0ABX9AHF4_9ENTR|nr:hypothetical protein [Symbiopectobacterium purcellii]QZN94124.1 hypothetical protein K6K13_12045 [Symbiopectobacterium purcellii]
MMPVDSFSVQRSEWPSPHELPSSLGLPHRTFAEWVYQVKNKPVDFDSKPKPPCKSSAKLTLMAVLRKLVGVFQREQSSQVSSQGKKANSQLDISSTGLMTKTPNIANLFRYLDYLAKEKNIGCVELITKELVGQSSSNCIQMMNNLKGWYGQHILGVLNFAVEQVAQAEEDPLKLSNASKYPVLLKELRRALQEKLEGYDGQISNGESIRFRYQLAPQDIEALSNLDINI